MRLLDAAFDVLGKAGEPLSPAEIFHRIKSANATTSTNDQSDQHRMVGCAGNLGAMRMVQDATKDVPRST